MYILPCSKKLFIYAILSLSLCIPTIISAQNNQPVAKKELTKNSSDFSVKEKNNIEKLDELSHAIQEKNKKLITLKNKVKKGLNNPDLKPEINAIKYQLDTLNKSFEQIAIGRINLDILGTDDQPKTWQEELTLVVKPLLENLRGLTEEPRRKENLRQIIENQKNTVSKAEQALSSIETLITQSPSKVQLNLLQTVKVDWLETKENAARQEQLALYQLNSLKGENANWLTRLKESLVRFARERGLTLLLATLAALTIWLILSAVRKLIETKSKTLGSHRNKTTYRVIAYAQKLLTVILIVIAILSVFFVRGDILLLMITLALLFAGALGLKNLLPQFIAESRLLLNIGSVREHEMVLVSGVPWRIASINIFSKLTNPEIIGTLRLPLSTLKDMVSRPVNDEKWFPSSIGDWVLDRDKNLYEVIKQTPAIVELQSTQGTNKLVPTENYFSAEFVNLSKSKQIRITNNFGIGYELQSISLDEVPNTFQIYVQKHLEKANLETTEIDVRVEFKEAGESSLNYIIIALLGSKASKYYYRIERTIQQACVDACNNKGWEIPFPQLTIHHIPIKK